MAVAQARYIKLCPLTYENREWLEWDAGKRTFFKPNQNIRELGNEQSIFEVPHQTRGSKPSMFDSKYLRAGSGEADGEDGVNTLESEATNGSRFRAVECTCAESARGEKSYCLLQNNENFCAVPEDSSLPVDCYRVTSSEIFTKNAFPVAILWLVALLLYLLGTEGGRLGLKYGISKICRCCGIPSLLRQGNNSIINYILGQERDSRRRAQNLSRHRASQDPVTYILKTREYRKELKKDPDQNEDLPSSPASSGDRTVPLSPDASYDDDENQQSGRKLSFEINSCIPCAKDIESSESENDQDICNDVNDSDEIEIEEETCAICFTEIEEGERVGVLPCEHLFHSECLKNWIKRKNVCPLCNAPDIARCKDGNNASPTSASGNTSTGLGRGSGGSQLRELNSGGRRFRRILVGDPANRQATVRIHVRRVNGNARGSRETPAERRERLNRMRIAWNP
ncbi:hypothetical protein CTEN210_15367 [Chaetoceros tenuissimus]|uniref:RING-type domain-containing protein n=1 Tax=Chaetoceros tenuissimus TaxID=426638 RepID=A0AAD3HD66_9STRA|nr:hypothetical protein CTEN210_15367 [Chaetoceros tenuissimus]